MRKNKLFLNILFVFLLGFSMNAFSADPIEPTWWQDIDGDGWGNTNNPQNGFTCPAGFTDQPGDCDDNNDAINPGIIETWYNGIDENCDGKNDYDKDGDGFVAKGYGAFAGGTAPDTGDCDDNNINKNPRLIVGDGIDQNCDGYEEWYGDIDGDGYRSEFSIVSSTNFGGTPFPGEFDASTPVDCDDHNSAINGDATEIVGDGIDQNCDGKEKWYADVDHDGYRTTDTIESTNITASGIGEAWATAPIDCDPNDSLINKENKYFRDADGDGFGNIDNIRWACSIPSGYVTDSTDCTDSDIDIHFAVGPVTITGLDFVPVGRPVTYTATAEHATGYMWSNSLPTLENTKTVTFTQHGINVLSVNADNDCSDRNGSITISVVDTAMLLNTIENLKTDTTTKANTIKSLNGHISTLNTVVTTLIADTIIKHNTIATLNGQVSGLNTQVTTLKADTIIKHNTITTLNGQLTTCSTTVTGLKTDTTTKAGIIIDLRTKLSQGKYTKYDTIRVTIKDTIRTTGLAEYKYMGDTLKFSTKNLVQLTAQVEVKVYPNPTRDMVILTSSTQFDEILVYNTSGVLRETIKPTSNTIQLKVSAYPAGTYYLSLRKGTVLLSKVIIVKN